MRGCSGALEALQGLHGGTASPVPTPQPYKWAQGNSPPCPALSLQLDTGGNSCTHPALVGGWGVSGGRHTTNSALE